MVLELQPKTEIKQPIVCNLYNQFKNNQILEIIKTIIAFIGELYGNKIPKKLKNSWMHGDSL